MFESYIVLTTYYCIHSHRSGVQANRKEVNKGEQNATCALLACQKSILLKYTKKNDTLCLFNVYIGFQVQRKEAPEVISLRSVR